MRKKHIWPLIFHRKNLIGDLFYANNSKVNGDCTAKYQQYMQLQELFATVVTFLWNLCWMLTTLSQRYFSRSLILWLIVFEIVDGVKQSVADLKIF